MITQYSTPSTNYPCVVQINYADGDIAFYLAIDNKDADDSYSGRIVAIFKPKNLKP